MTGIAPQGHARIFLLAGEPSGDMLGGRLIQALRAEGGDSLELFGVGGARMREQGLKSLFPMDELSLFGIAEVVPHLPRLARRLRQTVHEVARRRPDLVLTIDAPGFALRLQHRLTRLPLLRVHYVAPQVWAWRASRAARLTRDLDHLLALLPFLLGAGTLPGLGGFAEYLIGINVRHDCSMIGRAGRGRRSAWSYRGGRPGRLVPRAAARGTVPGFAA